MDSVADVCENCEQLQERIEELEERIEELERVLERIAQFCQAVIERARPMLSKRSGVPRGKWARLKGRVDVAKQILAALR